MNIPLIIILVYIFILFSISFISRKYSQTNSGFVLAGRQLKTPLIMLNVVGIAIGGASTIGVSETAYKIGLSAGWYNGAWSVAAILVGYVLAGKYRAANFTTIAEFLERYYGQNCSILTVLAQIIIQVVVTALQYIAGGSILHALLPEVFTFELGLLTSAIVFVTTTFIGGLWSASISNILNTTLIYFGIIMATIACVSAQGGLSNITAKLPANSPQMLDFFAGAGTATIVTWFSVMIPMVASLQGVIQVASSAIDTASAKRGYMLAGVLIFPMGFLSALLGIIARATFPNATATTAMPLTIMSLDPLLAGITLAALWAADISTACSMLLGASTMLSQDIGKKIINPNLSAKASLTITRVSVLVLGSIAYFLAGKVSGILSTIMIGLSLTAAFTLLMVATLYFPSICRKSSGFYTLLAGLLTLFIWQLFPAVRILPHLIYAEWLVCISVFTLVAIFDKNKIVIPAK